MAQSILVIDDDNGVLAAMSRALGNEGFEVVVAEAGLEGVAKFEKQDFEMVFLDLHLPDELGLSILPKLKAVRDVPVVMISGEGTVEDAVKAVQLGALDFVQKPLFPERISLSVKNALRVSSLSRQKAELEAELRPGYELLGTSQAMQQVRSLIERAGPTQGRVLITGENGTGKELVARAIHAASARSEEPFVALNCAAIPSDLFESELFGHEKGAFTGAVSMRRGRFELADKGTLFLDEIGELSMAVQAKMLRVLEEGQFERVGGTTPVTTDARIVAATNRDLQKMIAEETFREDLFYRLNVVRIHVPPLRERREDIPELATSFVAHQAQVNNRPAMELDAEARVALGEYDFRGNVRELRNLVERLVILCPGSVITGKDVRSTLGSAGATSQPAPGESALYRPEASFKELADDAQRRILEEALEQHGSMTETAKALKLERSHMYRKCKALGVDTP